MRKQTSSSACCGVLVLMKVAALVALMAASTAEAWTPVHGCKPFKEIYSSGEDLINRMWGQAFNYTLDEANAYTMWWFEGGEAGTGDPHSNPNDVITAALGLSVPDVCHLDYYHKDAPTAEGESFTECHPWHSSSCCHEATVVTPAAMNAGYGSGYEWDRCGPISQACERFFVQEACFYECEVNAGLYRRFSDAQHDACSADGVAGGANVTLTDGSSYTCTADPWDPTKNAENKWELYKMPIKASYADAWFRACANDLFCGGGDFFECAGDYHAQLAADEEAAQLAVEDGGDQLPLYAIVLIAVAGVLALLCTVAVFCLIRRERKGEPVFTKMAAGEEAAADFKSTEMSSTSPNGNNA